MLRKPPSYMANELPLVKRAIHQVDQGFGEIAINNTNSARNPRLQHRQSLWLEAELVEELRVLRRDEDDMWW